VESSDLVLHVRDIADPDSNAQAQDVEAVLSRLGLGEDRADRLIEVWNKVDLVPADDREMVETRARRNGEFACQAVAVSAVTGEGCDELLKLIASRIDDAPPIDVQFAASEGEAVAWLYRNGRVLERTESEDGSVQLQVKLDPQAMGRFERMYPQSILSPRPVSVED
jgi:GTP-binding protein HflX